MRPLDQGSRILNTSFDDYTYCDRFADIAEIDVGRFANIAAMTRIGPSDRPWRNAAQHHFLYRSSSYFGDIEDDAEFFAYYRFQKLQRVMVARPGGCTPRCA